MTILVVARCLEPDAEVTGRTSSLACPLRLQATTGEPCPACGLTTAFAWVVRGRFDRAIAANPAGGLLAPACVALVPWLLASSYAGRPLLGSTHDRWAAPDCSPWPPSALGLAAWTVRLILGRVLG